MVDPYRHFNKISTINLVFPKSLLTFLVSGLMGGRETAKMSSRLIIPIIPSHLTDRGVKVKEYSVLLVINIS